MVKKLFVFISLFFVTAFPAFACTLDLSPTSVSSGVSTPITMTYNGNNITAGWSLAFGTGTSVGALGQDFSNSGTIPSGCTDNGSSSNFSNFFCDADFTSKSMVRSISITGTTTLFAQSGNAGELCTADLTVSGGGGGVLGAVTLDPTMQANLNSGIGSLGTIVISEVISLLPYILGLVAVLFVVRFGINFFKGHAK